MFQYCRIYWIALTKVCG